MANRFFSPNQQFYNDTGVPYASGFLYFYASGTSTPLDTYSNSGLTIANTNPVILDSAGRAGSVFLANSAYKVKLTDLNNVEIWTEDPVWSSDYSTVAMFTVHTGTPNGTVAGTAGTQGGRPSDSVWDNVNNILYICTTSGTASTATWTAVNPASSAGAVALPTGRLTLTSGVPVLAVDATAQTAVYYTPYNGTTAPIYSGSTFTAQTFAELTLTLVSAHALNTLYDIFIFNNSSVLTLATGPAWSTSTAGLGARGTGAGTTQISQINGIWVNTVQMTGRNGSTTYTIAANAATYLGTILIDGTAGQCSCYVSWGQSRKFSVWNAYNRVPVIQQAGDATASWAYNTATWRPSNNSTANSISVLTGLAQEMFNLKFFQSAQTIDGNTTSSVSNGIGWNSTTVPSGKTGLHSSSLGIAGGFTQKKDITAEYVNPPTIGINTVTCLENGNSSNSATFIGTNAAMVLIAEYRG